MSSKVIGYRQTVMEQSFYNFNEQQWYHVARYFRHALHPTKGWQMTATKKLITKIHAKYAIVGTRITQTFERTRVSGQKTRRLLKVCP